MNGLLRAGLPALALAAAGLAAAKGAEIRRQTVSLTKGRPAATIEGRMQADRMVDDRIRAGAGQTLAVSLRSANASLNFNLLPPGSADAAMFIGHLQGREAQPMLPADGHYVVRVYLMRSAARRQESAACTPDLLLGGQALAPLPAAQDARIAGTRFHATADVPCLTPGSEADARCPAGVIRRGRDGTATVDMHGARGLLRSVLFVGGQPVASDSAQPMTSSRDGDVVTLRFGSDERYEVPDAPLTGG